MPTYKSQITPRKSTGWKRFMKRAYNKLMRRMAKRNPEEAPRQREYKGYD